MALSQLNCDRAEEEVFIFPASFAQQRLWFIDQLVSGTSIYTIPLVFRLAGTLNHSALEQTFNHLVDRHEVLRTTFDVVDGQLVQVIATTPPLSLPIVDLQVLPLSQRESEAIAQIQKATQQPFQLITGPLVRFHLWQLDKTDYRLLIHLHHIIFDEWSSGILIQELGTVYAALVEQRPIVLPELPIQYADFACWQREWLRGEILAQQLDYWRRQLQDLPMLQLWGEATISRGQNHQGAMQILELPQSLLDGLEQLSHQTGATLFMTLLAAFQVLLYRYTEQTDIVVGSPIANRHRHELEGLIGFFVNSLVLRTDLSGNPCFRELLDRIRHVTLDAYAHQDLPFEKLVEELQPSRQLDKHPLFQVVFALQNAPVGQLNLPDVTLSSVEFETQTARFDLELYFWKPSDDFRSLWGKDWQWSNGLRGIVIYDADLFQSETIARLRHHFQTLLEGIVAAPDRRISDLPLLTATEWQQLQIWNRTRTNYPQVFIQQVFEQQVELRPDAIALRHKNKLFSYKELNSGSNQLARHLQQLGLSTGTRIGIGLEQLPEAIAAMLATLKLGGVYVPLSAADPVERLHFILEDAQISVILTHRCWLQSLDSPFHPKQAQLIDLEVVWAAIAEADDTNLPAGSSNQLAYIMYTSGSTGTPKGVAVPHRAVNRLVYATNYIQVQPGDRIAQVANLAFDAATFEIWGALLNGAQLVSIEREVVLAPQDFVDHLRELKIDILFLTTALFNQIIDYQPESLRSLKYALFGGEKADPQRVRQVLQHGKPAHLLHVYGPTENTTFSTWYEVEEIPLNLSNLPIGRPVSNTQVYVLDAHFNPVPVGVVGEIYLAGDGLADGYFMRPELTQACFIENPRWGERLKLNSPQVCRFYKTGDRARYCIDGNLEFMGRIDDQIKLRGFRVELGEIAAVLKQHSTVQDAIAVMHSIASQPQLVAYIVPHAEAAFSPACLRHFLKSKLPTYMLPTSFIQIEHLPLTANGKVDRHALPSVLSGREAIATLPRTSIEAVLVKIWRKLLGREQIGVEDNFFECGGHSLLATQLVSRVRDQFQIEMPLRSLFESPTIAEFAQQIEKTLWTEPGIIADINYECYAEKHQPREETKF